MAGHRHILTTSEQRPGLAMTWLMTDDWLQSNLLPRTVTKTRKKRVTRTTFRSVGERSHVGVTRAQGTTPAMTLRANTYHRLRSTNAVRLYLQRGYTNLRVWHGV